MKWEKVEFGELYLLPSKNGLNRPSRVRGSGYKMINMGELFAFDRIKDIPMELVPMNDREIETSNILEEDLLFARQSIVASGAGKCSIVLEVPEITTFESHIIRVRLNTEKASPLYYYYYFKSPFANMKSLVQQGVQAGIRGSELKNLIVSYPPLPTQRRIASILSAYDDLIENNLKRIKLLEEKAFARYKLIVKSENNQPKIALGQLATITSSKRIFLSDYVDSGVPFYRSKEIIAKSKFESIDRPLYITEERYNEIKEKFGAPNSGDLLITSVGTIGFVHLVNEDDGVFYFKDGNLIWIRNLQQILSNYLFFKFKTREFKEMLNSIAIGSSQKALTIETVKKVEIEVPSDNALFEFNIETQPIIKFIYNLQKQNTKLREARDILLPKLMSGQIEV